MNREPKIGLVTVLYNGKEVLRGFFESIAKQTYKNYTLYIIDNSPDDEAITEAKLLANYYGIDVEFIKNNVNLGVAKGNNQGIERSIEAGCEYILLLNNDIEFESHIFENMIEYALANNEKIMVPKIYYYGTNKIWMAGGEISKLKGRGIHRGMMEEDTGQYNKIEYVRYAPTCFMLIHSEVFRKVGMMDEKYFVYYDDTDFVWRALAMGFQICYFPLSIVEHKVSYSTGGSESLFSIYYDNRNRLYFITKNFPFFYKITALLFFYLSRIVKYLQFNKEQRQVLVKAIIDFRKLVKEHY